MNLIWIMYLNNYFIFQESKNDLIDKSHIPNHWVQFFSKIFYSSQHNGNQNWRSPSSQQQSRISFKLRFERRRKPISVRISTTRHICNLAGLREGERRQDREGRIFLHRKLPRSQVRLVQMQFGNLGVRWSSHVQTSSNETWLSFRPQPFE